MAKSKQKKNQIRKRLVRKRTSSKEGRPLKSNNVFPLQNLPLELLRINDNWKEFGAAIVALARRSRNGLLEGAMFLVDLRGVGLKDCFRVEETTRAGFEASLAIFETMEFVDCSEKLAREVVWGGYFYGKRNGFRPPREFASSKKILAPMSEDEIPWDVFGKDGKPLIVGEYEDLMRRSGGKLRLDDPKIHYIVGQDVSSWEEEDPWEQLWVEDDDEGIPEGMEKLLFIKGIFLGQGIDFRDLYIELSTWEDLQLVELDLEEENATFDWTRPYPENHWNPAASLPGACQVLGTIELEGECLAVQVRTKGWMLVFYSRLVEVFEGRLLRGPLKIIDPCDLLYEDSLQTAAAGSEF